jgi:hypothetical protein
VRGVHEERALDHERLVHRVAVSEREPPCGRERVERAPVEYEQVVQRAQEREHVAGAADRVELDDQRAGRAVLAREQRQLRHRVDREVDRDPPRVAAEEPAQLGCDHVLGMDRRVHILAARALRGCLERAERHVLDHRGQYFAAVRGLVLVAHDHLPPEEDRCAS